jgi:hypothetical protein
VIGRRRKMMRNTSDTDCIGENGRTGESGCFANSRTSDRKHVKTGEVPYRKTRKPLIFLLARGDLKITSDRGWRNGIPFGDGNR